MYGFMAKSSIATLNICQILMRFCCDFRIDMDQLMLYSQSLQMSAKKCPFLFFLKNNSKPLTLL